MKFLTSIVFLVGIVALLLSHLLDGVPVEYPRDREVVEMVQRADRIGERRHQVVDELLQGRLSLAQAAEQFREISDELPYAFRSTIRSVCRPGVSDNELHYRHVMRYVESPARQYGGPSLEALRREMEERERREDWCLAR